MKSHARRHFALAISPPKAEAKVQLEEI